MKRILSLIMVVAMLCAVLALVGCGETEVEETTTEATTTEATTTEATTTEATTTEATTTEATTTEATTTEATTTEATTTEATTTEATTTEATTTSSTSATPAATIASGTTVPLYARFDFGTKTKAEDEGLTSHEYLTSILAYNADYLAVEYTEDTWVLYATQDYVSGLDADTFALRFENIVTYDFDAELTPGWGAWNGAPFTTANVGKSWVGKHQYMQVRMQNSSSNNMMSIHFMKASDASWSHAQIATCMYLQGGAPTSASEKKFTADPATEFETYTYDVNFLSGVAYYKNTHSSYMGWVDAVKAAGSISNGTTTQGNNWMWSPTIVGIKFHFMGAYAAGTNNGSVSQASFGDTRANIKQGNKVEVDYVIFGSSVDQLNAYTSYIEDAAK